MVNREEGHASAEIAESAEKLLKNHWNASVFSVASTVNSLYA